MPNTIRRMNKAIRAANYLRQYCEEQHWECIDCSFYGDDGHCGLYYFPFRWHKYNEIDKGEVIKDDSCR